MGREIKFRAWLIEEEQMVFSDCQCSSNREEIWNFYGTGLHVELQETIYREGGGEVHEEIRYAEVPQKIMQFTGLKDKKGSDIYEGDIVKKRFWHNNPPSKRPKIEFVDINMPIVFSEGKFTLDYSCTLPDYKVHFGSDWSNVEIVGNIYQNPELLNQKTTNEVL